jgi:hypothetical protein
MNHNLLRISSHEANETRESNSNFSVNFMNDDATSAISRIVVKSVDFPNVFYNICNNRGPNNTGNNIFTYLFAGVYESFTISPGQYCLTDLIDMLVTGLLSIGLTITVDKHTKKLVFSTSIPISMLNFKDGNLMADVLGIHTSDETPSTTHTAVAFPNLSGVQEVYVVSQRVSDGSNLLAPNGYHLPILAHVPITVDFGETQHYTSPHPELDDVVFPSARMGNTLREVDIKLTDKYGNVLDLGGLHTTIILKIYHNSP